MPKKKEQPKINPGDALRSLQEYNENVVGLIVLIRNFHNDIPEPIGSTLYNQANKIAEWYKNDE